MADVDLVAGRNLLDLQEDASNSRLILSVVLLACIGASMGSNYVYGGLTVESHLEEETTMEQRMFLVLTAEEASWYLSIVPMFYIFGVVTGYPSGEWLGRKKVLVITCVLSILGFIIMHLGREFWILAIGRGINSFSIGFGSMMPFTLISEITTIRARAPASVVANLSFSFGQLVTFAFAFCFPLSYLIYLSTVLSLVFLLLSPLLPESPHHLLRRGKVQEARTVYASLRGPAYRGVEQEVQEVLALSAVQEKQETWRARWSERTFLQPLAILVTLTFFISVNGLDCPLVFYGPTMFAEFG